MSTACSALWRLGARGAPPTLFTLRCPPRNPQPEALTPSNAAICLANGTFHGHDPDNAQFRLSSHINHLNLLITTPAETVHSKKLTDRFPPRNRTAQRTPDEPAVRNPA